MQPGRPNRNCTYSCSKLQNQIYHGIKLRMVAHIRPVPRCYQAHNVQGKNTKNMIYEILFHKLFI